MKTIASFALIILTACSRPGGSAQSPLIIYSPCDTFVSQFSSPRTPRLVRADTRMLLQVSFTPAKSKEADAIADAVKRGPAILRVGRTGRQLVAASLCNGCVEIQVDSAADAEAILCDLCFKAEENRVMPP